MSSIGASAEAFRASARSYHEPGKRFLPDYPERGTGEDPSATTNGGGSADAQAQRARLRLLARQVCPDHDAVGWRSARVTRQVLSSGDS